MDILLTVRVWAKAQPFHYLTYTADDNSNVIDPYAGVGGWEPCGVPVTTEPGVTYNWSFQLHLRVLGTHGMVQAII
jgi:hypothetical protein